VGSCGPRARRPPTAATWGDFAWAGGQAWKLETEGTSGRRAKLVAFDPGITEEEDSIKRDLFREDRLAERSAKPVAFRKDIDAALKDAAHRRSACFLKFETDWCGPCKLMTSFVFTAKAVADAADGLTCLVIDGDARKDLTERHAVNAYPTGILLDADGREIARYVGYQSVKETTAFSRSESRRERPRSMRKCRVATRSYSTSSADRATVKGSLPLNWSERSTLRATRVNKVAESRGGRPRTSGEDSAKHGGSDARGCPLRSMLQMTSNA